MTKYIPPEIGIGDTSTSYSYNLDKDITKILRPDGKEINFSYTSGGLLSSISTSQDQINIGYNSSNQVSSISNKNEEISYTYDGFLEKQVNFSGFVSGTISKNYNNDFKLTSISVLGNTINYNYLCMGKLG